MFNTILLPVDGSHLSFMPVQPAIDLARRLSARVVVLSVAEPRLYRASDDEARDAGQAAETLNLQAAEENVRRVHADACQAGVACEGVVSMSATPCDEILQTAQRAHCDLIVMATRGRMGVIDTLFRESTAQQVIRKSPVPVLIFP